MNCWEVGKQIRLPHDAIQLADWKKLKLEDKASCLLEALRKDALCALAWFNLGVDSIAQAKRDDAFFAFLVAGLIGRTDTEAWANALLLSLELPSYQRLAGVIALAAYQINGQEFLNQVCKLTERQKPGFPSDELVDAVWKVVNSVERRKQGFEFRVLGDGTSYQSIETGSDLTPKRNSEE